MIRSIKNKDDSSDSEKNGTVKVIIKILLLLETFDYQGFLFDERELFETNTETVDELIEKKLEESEASTVANDQDNENFLRPILLLF